VKCDALFQSSNSQGGFANGIIPMDGV
jgi:hypothetical protein